ncbi:MAG: hypothetical protein Aurels2KO_46370 [Aureliella sp.]
MINEQRDEPGPRLSFRFVWAEVLAFLSWEKGAFYTLACLLFRPGRTVHRYLDGHRQRLTNPIRFLLMAVAAVTAAYIFLLPRVAYFEAASIAESMQADDEIPPEVEERVEAARDLLGQLATAGETPAESTDSGSSQGEKSQVTKGSRTGLKIVRKNAGQALEDLDRTLVKRAGEISLTWMNVFLLFALPVNSLISWLFFRAAQLNLAEHVAANAYILAIQNATAVLTVPIAWIAPGSLGVVTLMYMLFSFIYQFWAWRQVFGLRSWAKLSICFFGLVLSVIGFIVLQAIATALILTFAF